MDSSLCRGCSFECGLLAASGVSTIGCSTTTSGDPVLEGTEKKKTDYLSK